MENKDTQLTSSATAHPLKENEDFYWESGFMVFTEAYHKKRGYCCQSGCRHCPYGFNKKLTK